MPKVKPKRSSARSISAKLAEVGVAAPQVVAHRLTRMALAGPVLSARDRKEFTGMVAEKQAAFTQAWFGMLAESMRLQQQLVLSLFTFSTPQQHSARIHKAASRIANAGIAPVHRKATANARRLVRTKLR